MPARHRQLASFISAHREKAGLSPSELAAEVGMTRQAVHYWESGKALPQATILEPLARALKVSYEDLYALAGYTPDTLPSGGPYLRTKFPGASKRKLAEAERLYAELEADEGKRATRKKGKRS
jgi:transcriptional regulator with XRE-family HTH domain